MILIAPAGAVVMTFAAVIIAVFLIIFFIWRINVEEKKFKDEDSILIASMISKNQMKEAVDLYSTRIGDFGTFTLFYIVINDYESVRNAIGEENYENVFKSIAERLVYRFKGTANIASMSDDSFLIFDKREYSYDMIEEISQELLDLVGDNGGLSRNENIHITASLGVVSYPNCGTNFKELFSNLEIAIYTANKQGGNQYVIYYNELKEEEGSNLQYFNEVRQAMKNKELCLYYQPIINIKNGSLFGFEGLLRWNHPQHGIIAPSKFITILEQSGDINYVSSWALEQAYITLDKLQKKFPKLNLSITINLSVKQLMEEKMAEDFKNVAKKYSKINPQNIVLEIAEFAMYEKLQTIKVNLMRLRDYGFSISVDGLGLDYNTLAQIEKEPINIMKLDKEFLEDINNNYMKEKYVKMLVESQSHTNHIIVCEGVETKEAVNYIMKNGIEYGQGYYFSAPFPEFDLENYISNKDWLSKIGFDTDENSENVVEKSDKYEEKVKTEEKK